MLRLANPGSDIGSITRIYQALFDALAEREPFSLDDMSKALVNKGLATSSGFSGEMALARSTRTDRSRDPLYNQSKMYSEIFRYLGWIRPGAESQLAFTHTWLGFHVARAGRHSDALVRESILGMVVPNASIEAQGGYRLRIFGCILLTANALGGYISRDEMIVGPLSLSDDLNEEKFSAMIRYLSGLRNGKGAKLSAAISKVSNERGIQINTLQNYTRFPIAALDWTGWCEKERNRTFYGSSASFQRLTALGKQTVEMLMTTPDLRIDSLKSAGAGAIEAAARFGAFSMLARGGLNIDQQQQSMREWSDYLADRRIVKRGTSSIVFSPFVELPLGELDRAFPRKVRTVTSKRTSTASPLRVDRASRVVAEVHVSSSSALVKSIEAQEAEPASRLRLQLVSRKDPASVAELLFQEYRSANKGDFYPAVVELFRLAGYDCRLSRAGVNYSRNDAIIVLEKDSVPIEIKSPGEELFLSVKGVRQALENKVILLSRKELPCSRDTTSLVVGYLPPNDRSAVESLIEDIHDAFSLRIGVLDFKSLLFLAASSLGGHSHQHEKLLSARGIIDVRRS
jgi:hypothetical protein